MNKEYQELYNTLDEYYDKFGVDYKVDIFTRPPLDETIKDIKDRIKNNNPQKEWDPKNDYLI